jgi:glycylpeptide N-tetradecanoyltransferase
MHQFWDKQPVPHNEAHKVGEIEEERKSYTEPLKLPGDFVWSEFSFEDIHAFVKEHYVSDDRFKLEYDFSTMRWASEASGHEHICIALAETGKLVGYISSVPSKVRVVEDVLNMVDINFLCVHPSYRNNRLAPILISEAKRRANTNNIWQAVYTAETKIPTPITKSHYWHRFLDVKYLIKSGFYQTNRPREKYYELQGRSMFRKMTSKDVPKVTKILKTYFEKFKIAPVINEKWVRYWILPIHAYVNDQSDDFISFYEIPYERTDGSYTVKQVYSYYMVGDVYNDAFILARNQGYHVFNTLDIGQTDESIEKFKFMKGTGHVYYYLFNWGLREDIKKEDVQLKLP